MERNQSPLFNAKLVDHENGVRVYEPPGSASDTPAYQGVAGGAWSDSVTPHPFQGVASGSGGLSPGNSSGVSFKRKRGRPRKYGPDGTPILAVSPLSRSPAPTPSTATFSPATNMAATVAAEGAKKARGRPRGSTNKRHIKALGSTGAGFMPHVITVQTGEDVSAKILEFSQQSRRAVCVLSANGAIANASLCQTSTSGGPVTYEGRFEVLSLSGSFLLTHSGGQWSRTGGLSVSLAGPDGHVIGGGVAGVLMAASPVQVREIMQHLANQNSSVDPFVNFYHSPIFFKEAYIWQKKALKFSWLVIVCSFTSEGKKETGHFSLSGPSASGAKDFETLVSLAGSFSP